MMRNRDVEKYIVKKEDTLWDIAEKKLGDATKWHKITKASDGTTYTKEEAKNIPIGEIIHIPKIESKKKVNKDQDYNENKSNKANSGITHKELLTFSNLTNLEWQFVNLEPEEKNGDDVYPKLNNLLSNPKKFVQTDRMGNIKAYRYGANEKGEFISKELGLAEMRKEAGMAMEYLEKEEGDFLQQWEEINQFTD